MKIIHIFSDIEFLVHPSLINRTGIAGRQFVLSPILLNFRMLQINLISPPPAIQFPLWYAWHFFVTAASVQSNSRHALLSYVDPCIDIRLADCPLWTIAPNLYNSENTLPGRNAFINILHLGPYSFKLTTWVDRNGRTLYCQLFTVLLSLLWWDYTLEFGTRAQVTHSRKTKTKPPTSDRGAYTKNQKHQLQIIVVTLTSFRNCLSYFTINKEIFLLDII